MNPALFVLAWLAAAPAAHAPAAAPSVVFRHVTVIDATGAPARPDRDVVIRGGRIAAVDSAGRVPLPRDARTIDATGKFMIPGLWDMHGHLTDATEAAFPLLVMNGITGVRDLGGDLARIDRWRAEIEKGERLGPRIVRAGPFVDGVKPGVPHRLTVTTPEQARRAVDSLKTLGVDFIKVHNLLPRDAFFALLARARERGLPVAVHLPHGVSSAEASDSGATSLEHIETLVESALYRTGATAKEMDQALAESSGPAGDSLFARFARNGTWYVPTLVAYYRGFALWSNRPGAASRRIPVFRRFLEITAAMHRAGVGILTGSDFTEFGVGILPGADLHQELAFLVEAGFTPMEALQAATVKCAEYLGLRDSLGTVEPGKVADLVLLDGDPLDNINCTRLVNTVVLRGRLVPVAAARARIAAGEATATATR
jgi:imidazolonepropionase-like amidohydrolase